jgi:hypothetical protein
MSTLNKIKVEDTIYDLEDTQARTELLNKIDKVEGKVLSTNDFTNGDKAKLDSLSNYDDTEIREELNSKQDNLVSGTNIKTINGESILGEGDMEIQGGSSEWRLIGEITTTEEVGSVQIVSDTVLNEIIAYVSVPPITTDTVADTGGTIYIRPVLKNQKALNVNVGLNKPSTSAQRELWHITRNWCMRQYWKGSGATPGVLSGVTEEGFDRITEDYNNEGGLVGFDITWNTSHKFPVGVIMKVWGR